jgi:ribosomal-protein-alanine N-acetyltransferase
MTAVVTPLRAPVAAADRAAVLALERAVEVRPLGWDALGAEAALGPHEGCLLLLREDGLPVGFAAARMLAGVAHVLRLSVAPDRRRRGHGRRLLERLLAWAEEAGAAEVTLEVRRGNAAARALYATADFVPVGRRPRYYPDGEDAELMTRPVVGG